MIISIIHSAYFIAAIAFIFGLRQMSSPRTARLGIIVAGIAMLLAIVVTAFNPALHHLLNFSLMIIAIIIGCLFAYFSGKKVAMTHMPQMIALYNGMGGGAAGAIAALELLQGSLHNHVILILAVLGAIIGTVSFSGSLIAFAKLQNLIKRVIIFPFHNTLNAILVLIIIGLAISVVISPSHLIIITLLFIVLLILGVTVTLSIGGANMPVIISLFNAMTGLAVGFEGFVLNNEAMIIAGTVVGAAGTLLTQLMAKAMNQSLWTILFTPPQASTEQDDDIAGSLKSMEINDAAILLSYAKKIIIAPGYGMAVAQAQYKIWELADLLSSKGVSVKFAIHPVAGRMPGHMNVLLAEAGVSYEQIFDLDEINPEFDKTDVVLVIGANDVVNPAAREQEDSPIFGMPILNVDKAQEVLVIKRGQGKGFSGIVNSLFYAEHTHMLYGDAEKVVNNLIQAIKQN